MYVLDAPIQRVVIHTDRARVIRQGTIRLSGGECVIDIADLPMTLDDRSVRATSVNPDVQIVDVGVLIEDKPTILPPEVEALRAQYDELISIDQQLVDDDQIEEERLTFLRDLREAASDAMGRALADGEMPLKNIDELIDYISDQQRESNSRRREIATGRRDISAKLAELRKKAPPGVSLRPEDGWIEGDDDDDEPRSPFGKRVFGRSASSSSNNSNNDDEPSDRRVRRGRSQKSRTIQLTVFVEQDGDYEISVSYLVSRVSWKPFYDIRVADENDFAISMLAEIKQQSGEDWVDVPISLSTARPSQDADLPKLKPWIIGAAPPPQRRGSPFGGSSSSRSDSSGSRFGSSFSSRRPFPPPPSRSPFGRASSDSSKERATSNPVKLDQEPEKISSSVPVVNYNVAQRLHIPSGTEATKAFIANFQIEGQLDIMAIPEESETAFMFARLRNTTDQTLLQGSALIFYGTHYTGKIAMEHIAPRQQFMVRLIEHAYLRAQRHLEKHSESPSPTEGKVRSDYIYRVKVFNDGDTPVSLVVYDHIPVANHKDIAVHLQAAVPQPSVPHNPDTNIFEWRITVPPQAHHSITVGFAVDHPAGMDILSKRNY